jgi:hypothetical protein
VGWRRSDRPVRVGSDAVGANDGGSLGDRYLVGDVPVETLDLGLPGRMMAPLLVPLSLLGARLGTHDA